MTITAPSLTQTSENFSLPASVVGNAVARWTTLKSKVSELILDTALSGAVTSPARSASRFDLRAYAEAQIAQLMAVGHYDYSEASRSRTTAILNETLVPNGPTPQIGATPDNSLEIQWLVSGTFASMIIEHDGYVSVCAETGSQEFEAEFEPDEELSTDDTFQVVCGIVAGMSSNVVRRPIDWPGSNVLSF